MRKFISPDGVTRSYEWFEKDIAVVVPYDYKKVKELCEEAREIGFAYPTNDSSMEDTRTIFFKVERSTQKVKWSRSPYLHDDSDLRYVHRVVWGGQFVEMTYECFLAKIKAERSRMRQALGLA